jgi:glycosyltransferase involved in cell wall biosynthesis
VSNSGKTVTILVPVYNEERVIPLFFARLQPVLQELKARQYIPHVVFLNNASTDGSLAAIAAIRERQDDIYVLSLAKNVGYQRSLECGLRNSTGDLFVFIDVDCEDPPEMILAFVEQHTQGYDIVYGERVDRIEVAPIKFLRRIFYRILRATADEDIILDMAEFSLMTNEVREALVQDNSSFPFIRASIARVGFRRKGIPYRRDRRIAGETHYNIRGMVIFAVAGLLSASTVLLRLAVYLLPLWLVTMIALGVVSSVWQAEWAFTWLIVLGFAYCGTVLSFVSMYLARVYKNTLGRPNAFIDQKRSSLQAQ